MSPFHKIYHSVRRLFFPKYYKIQSFTFYVPSPPPRKVGYREKEFDKIFYSFINNGYEILEFKTQTNSNQAHSGMWLIFIVRSTNSASSKLNLEEEFGNYDYEEEPIEGLYQIDDSNDFL
jgi:hypothetical protein